MSSTEPNRTAPTGGGRVTVIGNPGLDTLVLLAEDVPDLSADGHFVRNVDTVGHAAAYVARNMGRLGHRTRILGAIGDDLAGRMVQEVLVDEGVDTLLLFADPAGTPRSVNLVSPGGGRTYLFDGGSHMTLVPPEDLVAAALEGPDLVVSALPNWGRAVVARARDLGLPVAVDLQDVRDVDDPYRSDFIAAADHLFASAAHLEDPEAAAAAWMGRGPARSVVFGMGSRGALLVERTDAGLHVSHQPAPDLDLPVVDTTGAGDALACGFLDGLLFRGLAPAASLHRGQVLARLVASAPGGAAGFDAGRLDSLTGRT
jgi:sugar/nucleoside kinase (ribokinase family)